MTEIEILRKVAGCVVRVLSGTGCACIKDLPGDNYTCSDHAFLISYARGNRGSILEREVKTTIQDRV